MQSRSRLFDDVAKLAGSAIGTLDGIRRELEALAREQVERMLDRMDLVTREEFDAVKAMAAKAREENEALSARIEKLEAAQAKRRASATKSRAKSTSHPAARRTAKEGGTGGSAAS